MILPNGVDLLCWKPMPARQKTRNFSVGNRCWLGQGQTETFQLINAKVKLNHIGILRQDPSPTRGCGKKIDAGEGESIRKVSMRTETPGDKKPGVDGARLELLNCAKSPDNQHVRSRPKDRWQLSGERKRKTLPLRWHRHHCWLRGNAAP